MQRLHLGTCHLLGSQTTLEQPIQQEVACSLFLPNQNSFSSTYPSVYNEQGLKGWRQVRGGLGGVAEW